MVYKRIKKNGDYNTQVKKEKEQLDFVRKMFGVPGYLTDGSFKHIRIIPGKYRLILHFTNKYEGLENEYQ